MCHAVLAAVSSCYPPRIGRLLTRYSPVRHSVNSTSIRKLPQNRFVRLACVRHAASVHPEPGSNSHVIVCFQVQNLAWLILNRSTVFKVFVLNVLIHGQNLGHFLRIFRVLHTVQFSRSFAADSFGRLPVSAATLILYHIFGRLSTTFYFFLLSVFPEEALPRRSRRVL